MLCLNMLQNLGTWGWLAGAFGAVSTFLLLAHGTPYNGTIAFFALALGCAAAEFLQAYFQPEQRLWGWRQIKRRLPRPVTIRAAAATAVLLHVSLMFGSGALDNYSWLNDPERWRNVALAIIGFGIVRHVAEYFWRDLPADVPEAGPRSVPLNILCFLVPPLGVAVWLARDNTAPRLARSALRSATRGLLVALVAGYFLYLNWLVNVAIKAIGMARIEPLSTSRIQRLERERAQRKARNVRGTQPSPASSQKKLVQPPAKAGQPRN